MSAFDITLYRAATVGYLELRYRADAGKVEKLGHHRPCHTVRRIGRELAEENQIVAAVPQLGREGAGDRKAVERNLVRLEVHAAIGAHAQRLADRLLYCIRALGEHNYYDLTSIYFLFHRGIDCPR